MAKRSQNDEKKRMSYDRPMRTLYRSILLTLLACALFAADTPTVPTEPPPVNVAGVSMLISKDQLLLRSLQLAISQQQIVQLQAEAKVREYADQINRTIEDLKVQYACPGCTLNADFTWTKPEPVKAPESKPPAPQKDGPNPTKE